MLPHIKRITANALAHQGIRRYASNTAWVVAEQLLRMIAALLVGIWVARYLGPTKFGQFNYALAFVAIFGAVAKLGMDAIVVRELITDPGKRDVFLGTAFWLKVIGAILTFCLIGLVAAIANTNQTTTLFIEVIASGVIFQSFEVIDFYFQSKVLSKFVSLCKLLQLMISSLLKIYGVLTGADLIWFVAITVVDQVMLAITLHIAYRYQKIGSFYRRFDLLIAKSLLKDSWPMVFSALVIMIYMRIDQIMIKEMLGDKEVGIYSAAVRISEVWYFIPILITKSLFPAIVNAKSASGTLYDARIQKLIALMMWLAIGIALPMTLLSEWIVTFLYGAAYKEAGQVLNVHIWAGVFVFVGVASGSWLTSENFQLIAFFRTLTGAILNVALNFILIPKYGLIGAAIATLISQAFATTILDLFHNKTRNLFFMKLKALTLIGLLSRPKRH